MEEDLHGIVQRTYLTEWESRDVRAVVRFGMSIRVYLERYHISLIGCLQ